MTLNRFGFVKLFFFESRHCGIKSLCWEGFVSLKLEKLFHSNCIATTFCSVLISDQYKRSSMRKANNDCLCDEMNEQWSFYDSLIQFEYFWRGKLSLMFSLFVHFIPLLLNPQTKLSCYINCARWNISTTVSDKAVFGGFLKKICRRKVNQRLKSFLRLMSSSAENTNYAP